MARTLTFGLALLTTLSTLNCGFRDRVRQIETFANMQTTRDLLEQEIGAHGGYLDARGAQRIIDGFMDGRDRWGNRLVYYPAIQSSGHRYLLVSLGSDGKLDVARIEDYLTLPNVDIRGKVTHDIVVRDGDFVTKAGK